MSSGSNWSWDTNAWATDEESEGEEDEAPSDVCDIMKLKQEQRKIQER